MYRFVALGLLLFCCASLALAQTHPVDRGSFLIGGTAGFESEGFEDGDRITTIELHPTLGLFLAPGLALGAGVSLQTISVGGESATALGIGPFLAYFFGSADTSVFPFISGGVAYASSSSGGLDVSSFGGELTGGLVFMLARNVGLNAQAYARFTSTTFDLGGFDAKVSGNAFGLRAGVTAFIF